MRALPFAVLAIFVAGCATVPTSQPSQKIAVYDHRNMVAKYVDRPPESEFVGTSAKVQSAPKAEPSWYRFGHP